MQIGRRRIGVFWQTGACGRSGWAGVRAALARHGERIAGEDAYRRGTQFTATMRGQTKLHRAAAPDAVICIGAYAACAAFARDAVDPGPRVPIANLSFAGSESMLGPGNPVHHVDVIHALDPSRSPRCTVSTSASSRTSPRVQQR